ncbi:MAG: hypothetical protein A2X40_01595 [Elusimicrobia bacterium GWC2_65_9]|nr:MAG: hypothetical protein A2X37_04830 [Elusimicrobia bacterium GWA2_66_18]OGR71925.1 MAG: hypothetical protein A2X40_01595 [Elusimicrobia bacterium GWC2_65_9]
MDWTHAAPLAALVAAHATVQSYLLLQSGGLAGFSADSADRIILAFIWGGHPTFFIQPSAWLPVFFWIYGTLLRFWLDPLWAPIVFTVVLSNLSLLALYGICRRIGGGREGSLLAAAAAGFMPLSLQVSGQPYFDPLFILILLCAIHAWLRSEGGRRRGWHLASAAAMAAAALTRFEGWLFVAAWLALTRRRPGLRLRLLALAPIALYLLHEVAAYGGFEFLRLQRDRGLVSVPPLDWRVLDALWTKVFADGLLLPFILAAFPALDFRRAEVRETLGLVWLPFLAFIGMTQFLGFPLPFEHLAPFLALQMIPLAPALDRALEAWSSSLRAWAADWDRPARLALALVLILGVTVGAMMRTCQPPCSRAPIGFVKELGQKLKPGERFLLELPLVGSHNQDADERFEDPRMLQLAALPTEMEFDRIFRYRHGSTDDFFTLDTADPSVLELPEAELGRELKRLSVRLILARREHKKLERLGWRPAGELRHYLFYARAEDRLYPLLRSGMEPHGGRPGRKT